MTKIPSLADALAAAQVPAGPDCTVKLMALTLTKSEREALRAAFAPDSGIRHSAIAAALKASGKRQVSSDAVSRHRRGLCACSERGFTL